MKKYMLREVAGVYWLVYTDRTQPFRQPKRLNRSAYEILLSHLNGLSVEEIADNLVKEYGLSQHEALSDVTGLIALACE